MDLDLDFSFFLRNEFAFLRSCLVEASVDSARVPLVPSVMLTSVSDTGMLTFIFGTLDRRRHDSSKAYADLDKQES